MTPNLSNPSGGHRLAGEGLDFVRFFFGSSPISDVFDLDGIVDLVDDDFLGGLTIYLGLQLVFLAIIIAASVRRRLMRSPVDRLLRRGFGA